MRVTRSIDLHQRRILGNHMGGMKVVSHRNDALSDNYIQILACAFLRAAVCHNACQENKPVRPDDKHAVHREVGVT